MKNQTQKESREQSTSEVVSKRGATLEVRVIRMSEAARRQISRGLAFGKAAAYAKH
jgi:hypothetical protein